MPITSSREMRMKDAASIAAAAARIEAYSASMGYAYQFPPLKLRTERSLVREDPRYKTKAGFWRDGAITVKIGNVRGELVQDGIVAILDMNNIEAEKVNFALEMSRKRFSDRLLAHEYAHALQHMYAVEYGQHGAEQAPPAASGRNGAKKSTKLFNSWASEGCAMLFAASYVTRTGWDTVRRKSEIEDSLITDYAFHKKNRGVEAMKAVIAVFEMADPNMSVIEDIRQRAYLRNGGVKGDRKHAIGGMLALAVLAHNGFDPARSIRDMLNRPKIAEIIRQDMAAIRTAASIVRGIFEESSVHVAAPSGEEKHADGKGGGIAAWVSSAILGK